MAINKMEPTVRIPEKEYEYLKQDSELLHALFAAGVNNWEGYSEALRATSKEE